MVKIALWSLGGTISMTAPPVGSDGPGGAMPTLSASDFLTHLGPLSDDIIIETETIAIIGSANLTIGMLVELANRIRQSDYDAVVIAQGTDALEESSYLLSLLVGPDRAVVMTGAMRPASALSADGPANLRDALVLATNLSDGHPHLQPGVYILMNGEIHDPARVRKTHTAALNAFDSDGGIIGRIDEDRVIIDGRPRVQKSYAIDAMALCSIRLVTTTLDDDPDWVPHSLKDVSGLVVEGYGAGHLSEAWADMLEAIVSYMPVVLASRAGRGVIYQSTYSYKGAEMDLISRGLVPAGRLSGRKARLALMMAMAMPDIDWRVPFREMSQ